MSDLRNDLIQSALIAWLKTKTVILNELPDDDEIRENEWQGTNFSYPNVRIRLTSAVPQGNLDCNSWIIRFSVLVFSQQSSSYEADKIAGIINNVLHAHPFSYQNINFSLRTGNLIPAIRSDKLTWRSEVLMSGIVSG